MKNLSSKIHNQNNNRINLSSKTHNQNNNDDRDKQQERRQKEKCLPIPFLQKLFLHTMTETNIKKDNNNNNNNR